MRTLGYSSLNLGGHLGDPWYAEPQPEATEADYANESTKFERQDAAPPAAVLDTMAAAAAPKSAAVPIAVGVFLLLIAAGS